MTNLITHCCLVFSLWLFVPSVCAADNSTISNNQISISVRQRDGVYEVSANSPQHTVMRSLVATQIGRRWMKSTEYPRHDVRHSEFEDALGHGQQLSVSSTGLPNRPDLICVLRVYDELPFGYVEVQVNNATPRTIEVQTIRSVEALGTPLLDLGASEDLVRVLSDGFTENSVRIADLGQAQDGMHTAVGSQLIYNRTTGQSLFFGALSADRFLTIIHLQAAGTKNRSTVTSFTIDSTGTTEVRYPPQFRPPDDRIELSLHIAPGKSVSAEPVMFALGNDYHAQLESYGDAIRRLHRARVNAKSMMGWWSWTGFYDTINEGILDKNAQILADSLKSEGYDFFLVDEGYDRFRGEYTTANPGRFPDGLQSFAHGISRRGLNLGFWLAPLEVVTQASICNTHPDWFVHNAHGKPIVIKGDPGRLFVLDATHPGARKYLQQMVRTMTRDWGARYLKLDFLEETAIEGYYHRPNTTALEAERFALQAIRDAVGDDVLLDKDSSPMLPPVGIVDQGRTSGDSGHAFRTAKENAIGLFARYYMNRNWFVNDPDAFTIQREPPEVHTAILDPQENPLEPLTVGEAQVSIVLAALSGGMFEIGDDLATLQSEPERWKLLTNPNLLQMVKAGKASTPIDLLDYSPKDGQPSVAFVREDKDESILAVFNWTEETRSHTLGVSALGLPQDHRYAIYDALNDDMPLPFDGRTIAITNQPSHSVKLIKIVDTSASELRRLPLASDR